MDNLYSNNPRLGNIISVHGGMPVITGMSCHPSIDRGCRKALAKTPPVDPYSSRYNILIKLLQSNSPPSVMDNFGPTTPLKLNMEEETLVVDGIPVESSYGGSSLAYSHSRRLMHRAVEDNITNFPGSKSHVSASFSCIIVFQLQKTLITFSAAKTNLLNVEGFMLLIYFSEFVLSHKDSQKFDF